MSLKKSVEWTNGELEEGKLRLANVNELKGADQIQAIAILDATVSLVDS